MSMADVHSVHCWVHRVPHDHGIACHSTCPTCGGDAFDPDRRKVIEAEVDALTTKGGE